MVKLKKNQKQTPKITAGGKLWKEVYWHVLLIKKCRVLSLGFELRRLISIATVEPGSMWVLYPANPE